MQNSHLESYQEAIICLAHGGIIGYPTESVFGFGADPLNERAVLKILALKNRPIEKGLILIAAAWEILAPWVIALPAERMQAIFATWPGPYTWIFPASSFVPKWITGDHQTVAIRVSAHPQASKLCELYGKPLVSTSANLADAPPILTYAEIQRQFGNLLDYILPGEVGALPNPTQIRDGLTGKIIRD